MEYLTRTQIVLLALFVSFVSSMATGIVVVTLMQQAPEPVRQTLTRVIERTIEKVTPAPAPQKIVKTVIVKDEDLLVAAIEKNIKSIVALKTTGEDGVVISVGIGTIVSSDGLVITDKNNFDQGILTTKINGVAYILKRISSEKDITLGLGILTLVSPTMPETSPTIQQLFIPVLLGNPDLLNLGQTTVVMSGREGKTPVTGFINNLETRTLSDKEKKTEIKILEGIGISSRLTGTSNGAPIITLNGDVVGFLSIDEVLGTQLGIPAIEAKKLIAGGIKKI